MLSFAYEADDAGVRGRKDQRRSAGGRMRVESASARPALFLLG